MSKTDVELLADLGIEYEETIGRRWRAAGQVFPRASGECHVRVHRDDNDELLGASFVGAGGRYEVIIAYGGPVYARAVDGDRVGRSQVALPEEVK
jgi:hypothetical protein